ncbi:DUF1624 domain-containing protein [Acinetobacter sp. B5B]|uniref:DUF1624 domain-containing protein n=1 Tax=Acinetobacter baretiae TaxID=2605383 RepID=UPI0018C2BCED|nr:heparan-alpha-glucosaminide N-acetyltransferase domain-containing protein [Acinetobacter baretiae]MBF7683069.1 DUF1624 domain-containing protein [Acinetobacter baretiae]MBF7684279.1 DUF1624 domain-containing protein [Acinetobacter baretiae]
MSAQLSQRLLAIDALRGLIILIMMLDHVRDTFYVHHQVADPMVISQTEPTLYFGRVLAHLCAPMFVFLTGLSAYLYQAKNNNLSMTRAFLFKRGLFLILLEITVINFAWTGQLIPQVMYLQVIWAIGISMLALAGLIALPQKIRWVLALLIIFGHNLLDPISFKDVPSIQPLWNILHERGWIVLNDQFKLRTSYPVLPWIGVILLGYCFGEAWFGRHVLAKQRQNTLMKAGILFIAIFFVLRCINIYGDHPWVSMPTTLETMMSFFNLTKYPPSLLFILFNVGVGLLLLVFLEKKQMHSWIKPLVVYGSVPMFFYILHLFVLKLLYSIAVMQYGLNHGQYFGLDSVLSLWITAIILSIVLYPLVALFARFKHNNKQIRILKYF